MPMKPHKDEAQSEFMKRCVPEMMGDGKRDNDQAVAICMDIWKNKDKEKQVVPQGDEDKSEFMQRCREEGLDRATCSGIWDNYRSVEPIRKTHVSDGDGLDYVLSDSTVDRYGDVIDAKGWDIKSFNQNPVALFNHNGDAPIGKWKNLRVEQGGLRGRLELAKKGTSARIDEIRSLVEQGILRAVSVGFLPFKQEPLEGNKGYRYTQQELLECSLVSVPANPNALQVAKSLKISDDTLKAVFGEDATKEPLIKDRQISGKHAEKSIQNHRKSNMTPIAKRIEDVQTQLVALQDQLKTHLETVDDANPNADSLAVTDELTAKIELQEKALASLQAAEKRLATTVQKAEVGEDRAVVSSPRPFALPAQKVNPSDHIFRALTVELKHHCEGKKRPIADVLKSTYGEGDYADCTRAVMNIVTRTTTVPADTTTSGWAADLVTTAIADFMNLLTPVSIYPQLANRGGKFTFGRNGVVTIPYRESTPTLAGAFVAQGAAIPVRQGSFNTLSLTPKKLGVISSFTREIAEHSTPAIEALIRQGIVEDTAVAIDGILLDTNAATTTRPAGLRNGVSSITPGAASLAGLQADLKGLVNALATSSNGNFRSPVWLVSPGDLLTIAMYPTTVGDMVFRDEVGRGTLLGIPVIQSTSVTADTIYLIDAADFVSATGDTPQFSVSDQAVIVMDDTSPAALSAGGTVANTSRSLWQTDSLAVRMIMDINWAMRRTGMVQYVNPIGWN